MTGKQSITVVLISLLLVIGIDLVTNDLNTERYFWDFAFYFDMADHGLVGNDHLWAPLAYRPATPLLAGALSDIFSLSTVSGFKVIAYIGAVAQLTLVFALANHVRADFWRGLALVTVVALSLYNVKFLLFDVSRPDHLAYPLMILAMLALFRRRWALCLAVCCAGLLVREFLIIPAVIMLVVLAQDYRQTRTRSTLWIIAAAGILISLFVIAPRLLIPVQGSGQMVDPFNRADWASELIHAITSQRRIVNVLFNLISYTLPILLLITPQRLKIVWARLDGFRLIIGLYTALVLIFTLYGGTDLWRFTTYLFIPQVIILTRLLDVVPLVEIPYMLLFVALYNKIGCAIPNVLDPYLDFYGGYATRVNAVTLLRLFEIAVYIAGVVLLRWLIHLLEQFGEPALHYSNPCAQTYNDRMDH